MRYVQNQNRLEVVVQHGLAVLVGTSSVRFEVGLFRNDDDTASAEGFFTHVYVDRQTRRPAPIEPARRAAFEGLLWTA